MKKSIVLVLGMALTVFASAQAQDQTGIVKTRGRMGNGQLVRGKGIPDAVVQLADRSVVSKKSDGGFSIPVKGAKYRVKSVQKAGYQLVDPQVCRDYTFSKDTLYLVMETPEQLRADELEKERDLRRNMEKRLQEKEDEIAAMSISLEEKNRLLSQINLQRDENEKKIAEFAKYAAMLDYDTLDDFQRQVNSLMEEGEIEKAFALLRSRGGMDSRVREIRQEQAIEKEEEEELARQHQTLTQGKEGTRRKLEDAAKDCYNYYRGFYETSQIHSAIYYIKVRASLDTTNLAWQYDALSFLSLPWGDEDEAFPYFEIIRRNASPTDKVLMDSYYRVGLLYEKDNLSSKALECYKEALRIADFLGDDHERFVLTASIAKLYYKNGDYSKALEYRLNLLPILEVFGPDDRAFAGAYDGIGSVYQKMGNYTKALEYYKKALALRKNAIYFEKAESYIGISQLYYEMKDYSKALKNGLSAVALMEEFRDIDSQDYISDCGWVGTIYYRMGKLKDASEYYQKALDLYETGKKSDIKEVELLYEMAGKCCDEQEDYSKAVEYYTKAIPMLEELKGPEHLDVALLSNKIGIDDLKLENYSDAFTYFWRALSILRTEYGHNHLDVAVVYENMGAVCVNRDNYAAAILYYKEALSIRENLLGTDHPSLVDFYENLGDLYSITDRDEDASEYYEKAENLKKKSSTK